MSPVTGRSLLSTSLLLLLAAAARPLAAQQGPDSLVIDVAGKVTVLRSLAGLPRDTATSTFGAAPQHYSGVPLRALLEQAGFPRTRLRGPALSQYVVAQAVDGYRVVFGVGDLDTTLVTQRILVADSVEGRLLPPEEGHWRIVVAGDRGGARSVRLLTSLRVRESATP